MAAVRAAASALDDVCASVEEDLPRAIPENPGISDMLRQGDGQAGAHRMLAKYGTTETHEWMTRQLQKSSESILPVGEYTAVLEQVDAYRSSMLGFMENYDVIICPVSSFAALPHGESMMDKNRAGMNYTATYNITGWPSTVVRGGTSPDGLPIGIDLTGGLAGVNYAGPIVHCYATGRVTGRTDIGGLVGRNWGAVSATYATGSVSGVHITGGLIGANEGTLIASYSTGRTRGKYLSGGLIGANGGTLFAVYSTARTSGERATGGLVGINDGTIIESFWDIEKSDTSVGVGADDRNRDGRVGSGDIGRHTLGVKGRRTRQLRSPTGYTGIYIDWDRDFDNADGDFDEGTGGEDFWDFGTSGNYPLLKADSDGDGIANCQPNANEYGYTNTDTDANADTYCNRHLHANEYGYTNTNSYAHAHTDSYAHAD
ncbi:Halomucin [Geodia barretti]|uniref:Halomucin n=1 Tax=Geodia barretti TaxID=519541 RepID=A0AA35RAW4_GEOBA|nr:Halomucin [Geodia barretti]